MYLNNVRAANVFNDPRFRIKDPIDTFNITVSNFPSNHKTIFLLDRTPYLPASQKATESVDSIDTLNLTTLKPVGKSLWSLVVEACVQYNRIVKDLFSDQKLFSFIVNEKPNNARVINLWAHDYQDTNQALKILSQYKDLGLLNTNNVDISLRRGFRAALEVASEGSTIQKDTRSLEIHPNLHISNRCRVICVVYANYDEQVKELELIFMKELEVANQRARNWHDKMQIDKCNLVIVSISLENSNSKVNGHGEIEMSSILTTEVISIFAYADIAPKFLQLVQQHFFLKSATITEVPSDFDVESPLSHHSIEIVHSKDMNRELQWQGIHQDQITRGIRGCFHNTCVFTFMESSFFGEPEVGACSSFYAISVVDLKNPRSISFASHLKKGYNIQIGLPDDAGKLFTTHLVTCRAGKLCLQSFKITLDSIQSSIYMGSKIRKDVELPSMSKRICSENVHPPMD